MKIKIQRKDLLSGMQLVHGVVEKRNTMPILSHVLISAHDADSDVGSEDEGVISETSRSGRSTNLSFFATDLEIGISDHYPAQVIRPGKLTAPAGKLFEIVRKLPDGMIDIEQFDNYWISIESGNTYFKIAGLPPEEFPAFSISEGGSTVSVDAVLLSKLIRKTIFAVGENDSRYILNGILVHLQRVNESKSTLRFVAPDGHRMAFFDGVIKNTTEKSLEEQAILPKKAILEIRRLLGDAKNEKGGSEQEEPTLTFSKGLLTFKYKHTTLTTRLMQGNYPHYQQVIPNNNNKKIAVNRLAFEAALERVSILSQEKSDTIKMNVENGQITLHSNNPEMGEARESVQTSFQGESLESMFSARYLLDLLSVLDEEEVTFEFKDAVSSYIVREEGGKFLSIIMPLRD